MNLTHLTDDCPAKPEDVISALSGGDGKAPQAGTYLHLRNRGQVLVLQYALERYTEDLDLPTVYRQEAKQMLDELTRGSW